MPFEDWDVVVIDERPFIDNRTHPDTGERLFPKDFIVGRTVTATLTHRPTGTAFVRTDLLAPYNEARLKTYLTNTAAALEEGCASQSVSLLGRFTVEPPADTQSQDEKDKQAFIAAESTYLREKEVLDKLIAADPKSADALSAKLSALAQARDAAAKQAAESVAAVAIDASPVDVVRG